MVISPQPDTMTVSRVHDPSMKICFCTALLLLCAWVLQDQATAGDPAQVVETFANGQIDWSAGLLIASGVAAPPAESNAKSPQALEAAHSQARALALQNMRDIILQTRVDSLRSVGDVAAAKRSMMAKVVSLVKKAKAVRQVYLSDGTVEVTVQMPMYGGFAQLVLPEEIRQIEPIITVSNQNNAAENMRQASPSETTAKAYTGIVVDARRIPFSPALAPVIVDEKTREVYGSAFVSREFAVQQGMAGYARDMEAANRDARVSDNPLTVKGLGTVENNTSTIIISDADAWKIKSASEHLSLLKKCRVVIVVE